MKCEICHKGDAKVAIHKIIDGKDNELYVCEECARQGPNPVIEISDVSGRVLGKIDRKEFERKLSEALFGAIFNVAGDEILDFTDAKCPRCGMPRSEFRKNGRVGCGECYKVFANEIEPMIRDMHRGTVHVGKVPSFVARDHEISRVAAQLRSAIAEDRYEDAVVLRDRLNELRGSNATHGSTAQPKTGKNGAPRNGGGDGAQC